MRCSPRLVVVPVVALALLALGCSLDRAGVAGPQRDGGPCVPAEGGEECNGMDDDCDGTVDEGFALDTDLANCGTCGNACMAGPRGAPGCVAGECVLACDDGFADCNRLAVDGCEMSLSDPSTCGSCATACVAPTPLCEAGTSGSYACTDSCSGTTTPCGASCVDTQTNPSHCGGCDMPCPSRPSTAVSCVAGACEYACATGFESCDGDDANGCETSILSNTNCGVCGATCGYVNGTASCSTGSCVFMGCETGYGDCDTSLANGCETVTRTLTSCGGCGVACAFPHATASCDTGSCVFGACLAGFEDCDGMASNGCESDLTSTATCGTCARVCAAGQRCAPSGCVDPNSVAEVATGSDFSCARIADGRVYCWGGNASGQLGDGTTNQSNSPVQVTGLTDAIAIDAGDLHVCAIRAGGTVVCWGENAKYQVAHDSTTDRTTPTPAGAGVTGAVQISAGGEHTCIVRADGTVACWGRNNKSQLGTAGGDRGTAMDVTGITDGAHVTAGFDHTCLARTDGTVWCWGENGDRQLGDGTTMDRAAPVQVMGITDAVRVESSGTFSCALRRASGGAVSCWGDNASGQLADGTTSDSSTPRAIPGLASPVQVTVGDQHACARQSTGHVACWGLNGSGQLGDGTTSDRNAPVLVMMLANASHIAAGEAHTCAARADGTAACWGENAASQLGDGFTVDRTAPVAVLGLP